MFQPSQKTIKTKFNKSAMILQVQRFVHKSYPDKWILLMDADIILPNNFNNIFLEKEKDLDRNVLYGINRLDYWTPEDYKNKIGHRYPHMFMGYFQLYFDKTKYYVSNSQSAAECDVYFCNLFSKRNLLTSTEHVSHLGKDKINHYGRVSDQWTTMSPIELLSCSYSKELHISSQET